MGDRIVNTLVVDRFCSSPAGLVREFVAFDAANPNHAGTISSSDKIVFRDESGIELLAQNPRIVFGFGCTFKPSFFVRCSFLNDPSGREHEYRLRNPGACCPWKYEAIS
jgi:hypothetical protein